MNRPRATSSLRRNLAQSLLALAALLAAGRIAYLATQSDPAEASATAGLSSRAASAATAGQRELARPASATGSASAGAAATAGCAESAAAGSSSSVTRRSTGDSHDRQSDHDAQIAELYAACPMAMVVDLDTVQTAPEEVDRLLPPYQSTLHAPREDVPGGVGDEQTLPPHRRLIDRRPRAPLEPAVPRIRYPVALRQNSAPNGTSPPAFPRVAMAPESSAAMNSPAESPGASAPPTSDDWLIDPERWYTPDERGGATSDAAPAEPVDEPAVDAPGTSESPAHADEDVPLPVTEDAPPGAGPTFEALPQNEPQDTSQPTDSPGTPGLPGAWGNAPDAPESRPAPAHDLFPPPGATSPASSAAPAPSPATSPIGAPLGGDAASSQGEALPPPQTSTAPFAPPPIAGPAVGHSPASPGAPSANAADPPAVDPHLELFTKNAYPSARECATCHQEIYHEWSMSAHAYAAVSPMFHKFEQKLNDLSQGTVGYFCMRCHAPVATALCATRDTPLWELPEVAREGITCIACHRVQYVYGKSNGERRIEPGSVFAPVFGGIGGDGVAEAIHRKDHFKVKTSPEEKGPGQNIHVEGIYFDPLTRSEFCTPCHQVAVHPGIKLEVVWEQYRASPACKKGISCQDCHMGRVPGLPLGYATGPVAEISGKTVNEHRKRSNHIFYGPNYPIAHPGIFPFHLKANRWTMDEWLLFDWRAGWGTDAFEDAVADGLVTCEFPPVWAEVDDRYDAREIIEDNLKKIRHKRDIRREVMENGSHVDGPFFDGPLRRGQDIRFHYIITNKNEGHNLLTASLGAQPQFWANVVLIGPDGRRLWETGYTDSIGDVANIHSIDVRRKRIPYDWQLFNLQTMFLITGVKGTDREFYVPVNLDIDQLPFIRPGVQPISVINHPPFIRMESQSLPPLGSRRVPYRIPGHLVQQPGRYRLAFRLRSRAEPIYFMRFCEATPEMERAMNEWMIDVHPMTVEFDVR